MAKTTDPEIRTATTRDHAAVLRLLRTQLREHHVNTPARHLAAALTHVLRHPKIGRILVARAGDRVVGFAAISLVTPLEHGGRSAWLEELYVVPAQREHGTGTELLRAAVATAVKAGARAIDLEVDRDHARAARLYARHGFTPVPRARWVLALATDTTTHPPWRREKPAAVSGTSAARTARRQVQRGPRRRP